MVENALISYLGENKPSLISEITSYLTEAGGEFSGVTFATLGGVCELTMVYKTDGKKNLKDLQNDLEKLSSMAFEDPSTVSNPKKITHEDLNEMYKKSISGELF